MDDAPYTWTSETKNSFNFLTYWFSNCSNATLDVAWTSQNSTPIFAFLYWLPCQIVQSLYGNGEHYTSQVGLSRFSWYTILVSYLLIQSRFLNALYFLEGIVELPFMNYANKRPDHRPSESCTGLQRLLDIDEI